MTKTMTRAQATEATQRGERVERVDDQTGQAESLCWHPQLGFCVGSLDDVFAVERDGPIGHTYREVWTPRTFLGVWEEVRTFAEAEPAGTFKFNPLHMCVTEGIDGCAWVDSRRDGDLLPKGYWVRRMPAEVSERARAWEDTAFRQQDKLFEANERANELFKRVLGLEETCNKARDERDDARAQFAKVNELLGGRSVIEFIEWQRKAEAVMAQDALTWEALAKERLDLIEKQYARIQLLSGLLDEAEQSFRMYGHHDEANEIVFGRKAK